MDCRHIGWRIPGLVSFSTILRQRERMVLFGLWEGVDGVVDVSDVKLKVL